MKALRIHKIIENDGEVYLNGLPCKKGQHVEMIVLVETTEDKVRDHLTAHKLLNSGLIGLWKDRTDINNTVIYARHLREQAQRRSR